MNFGLLVVNPVVTEREGLAGGKGGGRRLGPGGAADPGRVYDGETLVGGSASSSGDSGISEAA